MRPVSSSSRTRSFPELAQRLIEMISPNLAAPIPSMLVARIQCANDPNLVNGFRIPRGSALLGAETALSRTRCEFRTAQDVVLTPIRVASAEYFLSAADLGLSTLPLPERPRSGVRMKLELPAGLSFNQLKLGSLRFYIGGLPDVALRLHELMVGACVGVLAGTAGRSGDSTRQFLAGDKRSRRGSSRRGGDAAGDAARAGRHAPAAGVFRVSRSASSSSTSPIWVPPSRKATGNTFEIALLFNRYVAPLEGAVDADNFQLHCVPAINLFERRADRLHLDDGATAYHVVPERTATLDYEVFDILNVRGFREDSEEVVFHPLFAAPQAEPKAGHAATTAPPVSRACPPIAASGKVRARATSAPRSSSRSSIRASFRTAA